MKKNLYGQVYVTENELADMLYQHPDLDLTRFLVEDPSRYNKAVRELFADMPQLDRYVAVDWAGIEDFDQAQQRRWHMPDQYQEMDIAQWVLDQCEGEAEVQRCGEELLLFMERGAFELLKYIKYLVDTMRANKIVWGVGRGSSVASFVLYKIGIHKINSLKYDLDPHEFLK
jgi:hypothetical protein